MGLLSLGNFKLLHNDKIGTDTQISCAFTFTIRFCLLPSVSAFVFLCRMEASGTTGVHVALLFGKCQIVGDY